MSWQDVKMSSRKVEGEALNWISIAVFLFPREHQHSSPPPLKKAPPGLQNGSRA